MDAVVIFDGDCEFCRISARFAQQRVRPRARFVALQHAPLHQLGVTHEQCLAAVHWVDPTGAYAGGRAVSRALLKSSGVWPVLGALANLPLLDVAVDRAYVWVAEHRPLIMRGLRALSSRSSAVREACNC